MRCWQSICSWSLGASLGFTVLIGSCSQKDSNDSLEASLSPSTVYAIPATAYSCQLKAKGTTTDSQDLAKSSFRFQTLSLKWKNTEGRKLTVVGMTITINDSRIEGGKYECDINSDEMAGYFPDGIGTSGKQFGWPNGNFTSSYQATYKDTSGAVQKFNAGELYIQDGVLALPDGGGDYVTMCSPRCGGLNVLSTVTEDATFSGQLNVIAFSTDSSGSDDRPEYAQSHFQIQYMVSPSN